MGLHRPPDIRVVREPGVTGEGAKEQDAARPLTRRRGFGYATYMSAVLLFSFNGSVSAAIMQQGISPERLSQLRATAAFLVLLVICLLTRPKALKAGPKEIALLAVYGIVGVTPVQYLYFVAIHRLPVGIALLIEYTAPIYIALWVRFVRRQHVGRSLWLGMALALAGLALVAQVWRGATLDTIGVLAAFGAAVALMIWYLVGERSAGMRDPLTMTTWSFGFVALFWAVVKPWPEFPWQTLRGTSVLDSVAGDIHLPTWVLTGFMVIGGTVMAFSLVNVALRHLGASHASVIGMTEPVLSGLVAWLALGQSLVAVQILGGLVVLGGILLAEMSRQERRAA